MPQPWWKDRQAKPIETEPRTQANDADLLCATISDNAKFVVAMMHNEGVSKEIAAQRSQITRNLATPGQESVMCEEAKDPAHCQVAGGPGLGWRVVNINGQILIDHSGNDGDVKTFAFFVPGKQTRSGDFHKRK